jgi:mannonate dehydratase
MKVLREVNFDGVLIPNPIPVMADDYRLGTAYTIGYMKALLRRANEEVG